jgi:hypothetical protein
MLIESNAMAMAMVGQNRNQGGGTPMSVTYLGLIPSNSGGNHGVILMEPPPIHTHPIPWFRAFNFFDRNYIYFISINMYILL